MNFKNSLLSLLGQKEPVSRLSDLPFWPQYSDKCEADLNNAICYICNNYFYGFNTPVGSRAYLETEELKANNNNAKYILIPNIRDNDQSQILASNNYGRIPAATESIVRVENSIEEIFSKISRKQFRENMRYKRKAEEYFFTEDYLNDEITSEVLKSVSDIHDHHSIRHNNTINIFNEDVLKKMQENRESSNLRILLRKCRDTRTIVQVMILIEYPDEKIIHYQSQAIMRDLVSKNHNLYKVGFVEVYQHAIDNDYTHVNLGRGLTEYKQEFLAASIFYEQSHWFKKL